MSKNYNSTLQTNNSSLEEIITQLNNMPDAGEGLDTSDATATSGDILSGKTAYVDGEKVTGTIATKTASNLTANGATVTVPAGYYSAQTSKAVSTATQATPTVTINTNTGLITATATQTAGYVAAGTKSGTKQLAFQAAQTITPGTTNKTIAAGTYLGGTQTIKGDANLVASNIVSGKSIFGVVGTYEGSGGSGGDTSEEDGLVTRMITTCTNDRITSIGNYAFLSCSKLISVNFPNVTSIGISAFAGCSSLASVNFPNVTNIGISAFLNCPSLTNINFPKVTNIGSYAFEKCAGITSASFPKITIIYFKTFTRCSSLASISFPSAVRIDAYAFYECSSLTSISFPKVTNISSYAFYKCTGLTSVSFPVCTSIGSSAFERCAGITSASFPKVTSIGSYAFCSCTKLASIYLGASTVCTLGHSNAFSYTAIWSNKGSIFVPASLLASYKSATNWTFFSARIFSYNFT